MATRATESEFENAIIEVLDKQGKTKETIPIQFNPPEYSMDKTVEREDKKVPGFTTPPKQFASGTTETLSMELFFDTYEAGTDVRDHTDRIANLLEVDGSLHAPPVLRFVWGSFQFKCLLEKADKKFTLFLPNGLPVRARMNVTFKEYKTPEEQKAEEPRESADRTGVWTVTESDTIWLIATEEYGDPSKWKHIAQANDLDDPRTLQVGSRLVLPPLGEDS